MRLSIVLALLAISSTCAMAQGTSTVPSNPAILEAIRNVQSSVNTLQSTINGLPTPAPTPLAPTKASQLVALRSNGESCSVDADIAERVDTRTLADGSSAPFTIPNGSVFVITGIGFRGLVSPDPTTLTTYRYGLLTRTATAINVLMEDQVFSGPTQRDPAKTAAVPNIVVKAGIELCVFLTCGIACPSNQPNPAYLYGFFAKDE